MKRRLLESKKDVESIVVKCLTGAMLTPAELAEIRQTSTSDLLGVHGCNLQIVEQVKLHTKNELQRMRSQNQLSKIDGFVNESKNSQLRASIIKEVRKIHEVTHPGAYDALTAAFYAFIDAGGTCQELIDEATGFCETMNVE